MEPRSDIYSLGVTFYEMFTRVPFNPSSYKKPSQLNQMLPVDHIIAKAIAYKPVDRYHHVVDFCSDLINVLTGRKQNEVKTTSFRSLIFLRAAVLLFVILAVALVVFGSLKLFKYKWISDTKEQIKTQVNINASDKELSSVQSPNLESKNTLLIPPLHLTHKKLTIF